MTAPVAEVSLRNCSGSRPSDLLLADSAFAKNAHSLAPPSGDPGGHRSRSRRKLGRARAPDRRSRAANRSATRRPSLSRAVSALQARRGRRARANAGKAKSCRSISRPRAKGRLCITRRAPRGPVGAIAPFNFPLNLVAHKLSPALSVGASRVDAQARPPEPRHGARAAPPFSTSRIWFPVPSTWCTRSPKSANSSRATSA